MTIIVKTIGELGIEELKRRILANLEDLLKDVRMEIAQNGITVFRLSSETFQHKTVNPKVQDPRL